MTRIEVQIITFIMNGGGYLPFLPAEIISYISSV